jgi:hypothetical protein
MTSQMAHQNKAGYLTRAQGAITHIGPAGRGFMMLLVLALFAIPSVMMLFPRSVTSANAPLDVFSGERAMTHLQIIAVQPHPQGSPTLARVRDYLVGQLTEMGLEVEVQRTAGLENVVARLRGTEPTGAIVVLAHYDTVASSNGAADNSSTVAALLEIMRSLSAGPTPRNDVIALFDDGEEEPDAFSGTKAFVRQHPWMSDVRVAISIDTAVAGPISTNEVGPQDNGWLVHALARAYNGAAWTSFSGGGQYNSTPFSNVGIQVLALEDNFPFKEKHTSEDLPGIISASSVQQMGDQTLAIVRELGSVDLSNPRGKQETFFPTAFFGLAHYPEAWSTPLAVTAAILLVFAIGLSLWRGITSWRGLAVAFGTILITVGLIGFGVNALKPRLPGIFGWKTSAWPDWPEVIPPNGWLAVGLIDTLVLLFVVVLYILARHWSSRGDFSLTALSVFVIPAIALALNLPRTAYAFIWPVLIGSLGWIAVAVTYKKQFQWSQDIATTLAALPVVVLLLIFVPGVVMADGMKSLEILAAVEALLLAIVLPAIDGILVRRLHRSEPV